MRWRADDGRGNLGKVLARPRRADAGCCCRESFLDSNRGLKNETYELFRQHPELLVAEEEGMTKGAQRHSTTRLQALVYLQSCAGAISSLGCCPGF